MKTMTKAEARAALSAKRDADLARLLELSGSRLYMFKDDDPLSDSIVWRVRALMAEREIEKLKSDPFPDAIVRHVRAWLVERAASRTERIEQS